MKKKTFNFPKGELLLINKPYEWTSFDVVNKLRNTIKKCLKIDKIKVGHAGTLDPLATGLLILCTGKMTKQINTVQALDKTYKGTMYLGSTTPSYDRETKVDQEFDISKITEQQIKNTTKKFLGEIEQVPPRFSAVKVGGEAVYKKARKGIDVKIMPRPVTVYSFEIDKVELPLVYFTVTCSKGTYIRSLADDFGKALNNGAYLYDLCRTKIGDYDLKNAWELQKLVDYLYQNKDKLVSKEQEPE